MLEIISSIILPSLIAAFGWGIAPIFDKLALNNLDNNYFSVILYKFIFGGVLSVFLLFIGFKKVFKFKLDNKKHIKGLIFILLSSITTFLLGNLFYLKALSQAKYTVEIASDLFLGKSTIDRHKIIYALLDKYIKSGEIHALTIKAFTLDENK